MGETRPTVYARVSRAQKLTRAVVELTLNGANILDWRTGGAELSSPLFCVFWRFFTGPVMAPSCTLEPAMLKVGWKGTTERMHMLFVGCWFSPIFLRR